MIITSCPLRISLFGGSTDNPYFVEKYGYGSVISFTSNLKTYVTISQDKFGFNKNEHKYIINYSRREEVYSIEEIQNDVVRVVLDWFNMPPVQVTLTSDAYSQGSGLASSSSYIISLIKACLIFNKEDKFVSESDICKLAHQLELKFNPYCGYQDPYGCGIGGFKRIEFMNNYKIKHEFLSPFEIQSYDMNLIFTGVTRNSKEVLKSVTDNLNKVQPLLDTVDSAYEAIVNEDMPEFFRLLNESWEKKKETSHIITENKKIREIDAQLKNNPNVLAHKLCGAGNGGFFLTFSKPFGLTTKLDNVKIQMNMEGVKGESI